MQHVLCYLCGRHLQANAHPEHVSIQAVVQGQAAFDVSKLTDLLTLQQYLQHVQNLGPVYRSRGTMTHYAGFRPKLDIGAGFKVRTHQFHCLRCGGFRGRCRCGLSCRLSVFTAFSLLVFSLHPGVFACEARTQTNRRALSECTHRACLHFVQYTERAQTRIYLSSVGAAQQGV